MRASTLIVTSWTTSSTNKPWSWLRPWKSASYVKILRTPICERKIKNKRYVYERAERESEKKMGAKMRMRYGGSDRISPNVLENRRVYFYFFLISYTFPNCEGINYAYIRTSYVQTIYK